MPAEYQLFTVVLLGSIIGLVIKNSFKFKLPISYITFTQVVITVLLVTGSFAYIMVTGLQDFIAYLTKAFAFTGFLILLASYLGVGILDNIL